MKANAVLHAAACLVHAAAFLSRPSSGLLLPARPDATHRAGQRTASAARSSAWWQLGSRQDGIRSRPPLPATRTRSDSPASRLAARTGKKNSTSAASRHPGALNRQRRPPRPAKSPDNSSASNSDLRDGSRLGPRHAGEGTPLPPWKVLLDAVLSATDGPSAADPPYRECLEACFDAVEAPAALQVLDAMHRANVTPAAHECGLAVLTVCRASPTHERDRASLFPRAVRLATDRGDLPLAAYDAVLSLLGRDWTAAVRLLRAMEQRTPPAARSSPAVPDRTSEPLVAASGVGIGPPTAPAISTYRWVLESCVAAGQVEPACQVLRSCLERGVMPTSYAYELVIAALCRKLQWRRALQLLDDLEARQRPAAEGGGSSGGVLAPPTLACYNALLAALAKAREPVPALQLLARLRKNPALQPDIYSYNSALAAAAGSPRHWSDALRVLDQCQRHPGVEPDIFTYTNAIRACAKGGQTRRALALLQVAKDRKLPVDAYCYAAALEACAKARMWRRALDLLHEMQRERGLEPTEVTYSVCITACGNAGQWQEALRLLDEMNGRGLGANVVAYNAAITALARAAKQHPRAAAATTASDGDARDDDHATAAEPMWPRVQDLLAQMRGRGLEPDGFTYSSAISCCGAEGLWQEALDLLEEMQSNGPRTRPNKIAYSAAITSCGRAGQVDHALRLFQQMREQGISADRVSYNAVFSALRVSQRGDAAFELWRELIGSGPNTGNAARSPSSPRTIVAVDQASPDIITVTEVIAAVSADESAEAKDRVDQVFAEAVDRGILLRSNLDSQWDFDLSGMTLPVARAACRFLVRRIARSIHSGRDTDVQDLTFITGVGINHPRRHQGGSSKPNDDRNRDVSLRDFVQDVLLRDFGPSLTSMIPARAQGTVQIEKGVMLAWLAKQKEKPGERSSF